MKGLDDPQDRIISGAPKGWEMDDHGAVVYVIAPDENGPCKIGMTQNVGLRLIGIQVGCWMPLAVFSTRICFQRFGGHLGSLWTTMAIGAKYVEGETHKALKACDVHLHGEWFDVTAAEAAEAIEKSAKNKEAAAITLEQLCDIELEETATRLERDTHASLIKSLYQANSFARKSLDKIL